MAIRNVLVEGNELLAKKSRAVEKIDERIIELLNDMKETMYAKEGVGLAAPQVGVLKRIFVIDVGSGYIEFINPVISNEKGKEKGSEGCLSLPGIYGKVTRPKYITVLAVNRHGKEFKMQAKDFLARAICHEYDHLEGVLIRSKIEEYDN